MLKGRNILLGVTGSIAAYKSAALVRLLVKQNANVKVVLTPAAKDFITPLTLGTLSKNPVLSEFTTNTQSGEWNNHVDLGIWADAMLIAPASANTLSKMASGTCDNLLMACYLSCKAPVFVAPAMDLDMYQHQSTKDNLRKINSYGNRVIHPGTGELASGLYGEGRMEEPEQIVNTLADFFNADLPLKGKKVLVTAGPTYEAIDPVRFIGNHSSGKMGFAIAHEAARQGAQVQLVTGPSNENVKDENIKIVRITSAQEMFDACINVYDKIDIAILSAAVADFAPKTRVDKKIKKKDAELNVELTPTKDILAELGGQKQNQILVGFALETDHEIQNAKHKLERKNLDFIVMNSLNNPGAGFKHDTNQITIIDRENNIRNFELKSKVEVAKDIVNVLIQKTS